MQPGPAVSASAYEAGGLSWARARAELPAPEEVSRPGVRVQLLRGAPWTGHGATQFPHTLSYQPSSLKLPPPLPPLPAPSCSAPLRPLLFCVLQPMAVIVFLTVAVLGIVQTPLQVGDELDAAMHRLMQQRAEQLSWKMTAAAVYRVDPGAEWRGWGSPVPCCLPAVVVLGLCSWSRSPGPAAVALLEDQKKEL